MGIGLLLVYFGYGLAFWVMGLAVLLESTRMRGSVDAGALHWLAAFGMLHGTHEWLEAYLKEASALRAPLPAWLDWLRLGLLAVSFVCLMAYALLSIRQLPAGMDRPIRRYLLPVFVLLAAPLFRAVTQADQALELIPYLDAAARFTLAVPAAGLAALAVWGGMQKSHATPKDSLRPNLRLVAVAFAAYALAQLFVHQQPWFPASTLNQEAFLRSTGVPIQALRGIFAALIAVGLLRAMQAQERARQVELVTAHQARLAAVEQQDALRRDLLRHIVRSQEAERARIARELHDDVAQFLSAFSLQLGRLRRRLKASGSAEIVDQLQALSQQMSQSLHRLVRNLRPSHLDNLGLVPAIKFLLNQEFGEQGLQVTFNATGDLDPLPAPVDTVLFRVVQEALTNVLRHAGVGCASLDLTYGTGQVTLRVVDEGRGFDPAEAFMPPRGWGIAGMRERVEALGGRLNLRSGPSVGTTVEVVIPLQPDPVRSAS